MVTARLSSRAAHRTCRIYAKQVPRINSGLKRAGASVIVSAGAQRGHSGLKRAVTRRHLILAGRTRKGMILALSCRNGLAMEVW
jgi:hypothetical protein